MSIKERSEFILNVWDYLRGDISDPDIEPKLRTIKNCFEKWKEIKQEITTFLTYTPNKYFLEPTDNYIDLREKIIGSNGILDRLEQFIKDFNKIAEYDKKAKQKELVNFWKAADFLHESISALRITEGDNKYFIEKYF